MKSAVLSSYQKACQSYLEEDSQDFIKKLQISSQVIDMLLCKGQLLDQFQQAYQQRKKNLIIRFCRFGKLYTSVTFT